jgi:hypothetical protein
MFNDETDSLLAGRDKNGITIPSFKAFGWGDRFCRDSPLATGCIQVN